MTRLSPPFLPVLATAAFLLALLSAQDAQAVASVTYVVDNTADTNLTTCSAAPSDCTLRGAINASNTHTNTDTPDRIHFSIPSGGPKTITPLATLPIINDSLVIDAFTQPGIGQFGCAIVFNGGRCININGASAPNTPGLWIMADDVTIDGLAVYNFSNSYGILIESAASNVAVKRSYIGMLSGITAAPNRDGVGAVQGTSDVTIGDASGTGGNLISGNTDTGVYVHGSDSLVAGNLIGTDYGGGTARLNGTGVSVAGENNTVGGTTSAARNVISGNVTGILLNGTDQTVQGNYIGTSSSGTTSVQNDVGVEMAGVESLVGGTTAGAGNLISGNVSTCNCIGVKVTGNNNTIAGNIIGLKVNGAEQLQNVIGVQVTDDAQNTTIGGDSPAARNVISGNLTGIDVDSSSNTAIAGNYIGTNVAGDMAVGNGIGIVVEGSAVDIGGDSAGERNVISGSTQEAGVLIFGASGVTISGNFIGTNASGTSALPNSTGILAGITSSLTIGGPTAGERNVISGNMESGIHLIDQQDSAIEGNYIGLDVSGTAALPNADGVIATSEVNEVVAGNVIKDNVISGNLGDGVVLAAETGGTTNSNLITGNVIGLNAAGEQAAPNGRNGVLIQSSNGTAAGNRVGPVPGASEPNVISGNLGAGVHLVGDGTIVNFIEGAIIGTDEPGDNPFGNAQQGILISDGARGNLVLRNSIGANAIGVQIGGGTGTSTANSLYGNVIGENTGDGVLIEDPGNFIGTTEVELSSGPAGNGNTISDNGGAGIQSTANGPVFISGNSIDENGGKGILLGTPPSALNPPTFTRAQVEAGGTRVTGSVTGDADVPFTLEFFASPGCDDTGAGEGRDYLGSVIGDTGGTPTEAFDVVLPVAAAGGQVLTATSTNTNTRETTEFSVCFPISGPTPSPSPTPSEQPVTPTTTVTPAPTGVLGDADCDDDVDLDDLVGALSESAGVDPGADCADLADTDCDGDVDADDALRILAHFADVPRTPAPGCGPLGV